MKFLKCQKLTKMIRKIIFFVIAITLVSCFKKENVEESNLIDSTAVVIDDSYPTVVDSTALIVDEAAALVDENNNQNLPITFEEAERINTTASWKQFLDENPDYPNKEDIEDRIIRAEVSEIIADERTGEMPTAEKIGSTSSASSIIKIENDTSCDLIIRYSGKDAKKIVIAPNSEGEIRLKSGNYNVAASACGYNYAGSESLSGNYSVVYYISTVRY